MNTSDIIAICGVIGTLIAPIMALLYQKHLNERSFNKINKDRKQAIDGRWKGSFVQDNQKNKKQIKGTIAGSLRIKGKKIIGSIRIENNVHKTNPSFIVKGGLKNDRFLVLDYENEKNQIIQFGKLILELSAKADKMDGKFVSYGAESEDIIKGELELIKE